MRILNQEVPRVDGPAKVTGRAVYSHDVRLPGMLWARVLCCPYPVAKPALDLAPARAVDGAVAVIEVTDGRPSGWTRYLGQPVAAVAAETPEAADDALRAIGVSWELGDWVVDPEAALEEGAPVVVPEVGANLAHPREDGDEEAAMLLLDECDAVVEAEYVVPVQFHACLETHGVVIDYRGGNEAVVYASTQFTHGSAAEAARILGLAEKDVYTRVDHMGGGFGAKFDLDVPGRIACLLAKEAKRPVHLLLKRADEFLCAGNRSGNRAKLIGGASKDGRFRALVSDVHRHGGLGRGSYPGQPYIYSVEKHFTRMQSVYTHTDANRAMRAPGHPQASFGIESMVDELAWALKLDPLEFRKRNLADPVYHRQLERVAREIGWFEHPHRMGPQAELPEVARGIGFAVSTWGVRGRPGCQVDVRIDRDGSVTSSVGAQDLGTGTRTYVAGIVAERLGLRLEDVEARIGDSRLGFCVGSGGSTTVPSLAPAVMDAAHKAWEAIAAHAAQMLDSEAERMVARSSLVYDRDEPDRRMTWKEACATLGPGGIEVRGGYQPHLTGSGVHGAQAALVEVDTLTGELRVEKIVAMQDCGLPLNRTTTRSQVNGGVVQATSYALFEERLIDPVLGLAMNAGFEEYKLAGSRDVPEIVTLIDDEDQRQEAIGIGEPPVIPGHSAIANALFNACGVRLRSLPLTRDKIIDALARRA